MRKAEKVFRFTMSVPLAVRMSPGTIPILTRTASRENSPNCGNWLPEGAKYALHAGEYYPNHTAIDFYHHYKEDIRMFAEMGFKVFRMSIDWSRIYPTGMEEEPNRQGLEFYWNIFRELKKYNIEPLVTIWHGETPLYIENELLGWANRKTIELFKKYARTLFEEYKGVVHYWLTFNEINNALMFLNLLPTESAANDAQRTFTLLHHRLLASAEIVQMGHAIDPENKIGCMICYGESYPATCNPKDVIADNGIEADAAVLLQRCAGAWCLSFLLKPHLGEVWRTTGCDRRG